MTTSSSKRSRLIAKLIRPLISAGLIFGGLFQMVSPVLAAGTAAGTNIENRASATYTDPANGNTLNAESNAVTATVAEVAGLTNVAAGIVDVNTGSINSNDLVYYDFLVTNTGNALTSINVPLASITNPDGNLTIVGFQIDLNNDGDFNDLGEGAITLNDTNNDGDFADLNEITGILTADQVAAAIAADASIRVRVVTTVDAGLGAGAPVAIQLGNTPPNDNSAATQNQVYDADATVNDIYTSTGAPVNGAREAAANQGSAVSLAVTPLALATVLKTRANYNPNTAASLTDDTITYRLDFQVENTSPNPSFTPANLEGTTIRLDTTTNNGASPTDVTRILVSDVIPANTALTGGITPAGWTTVYSTTATTAPVVGGSAAGSAVWQTIPPATIGNTVRVGWVYTGTLAAGVTTTGDANGFQFQVVTSGLTAAGGTIANIAQAFGETVGDLTNEVVYDESGDQRPNNFNDDGTPPDATGTNYTPGTDTGVANPSTQDTDSNNNNTGTGPAGEANILPIVPQGTILNGPLNVPGATGPTNNQDDFVNKSSLLIADGPDAGTDPDTFTATPGQTLDPLPVVFNNTFQNPSSNANDLDTVRLLPLAPNNDSVPVASRQQAADIPGSADTDNANDTTVTITVGTSNASYRYDGTNYVFVSGSGPNFDNFDPDGAGPLLPANTLKFDNVNPGVSIDYTVTIDLPAGSALSADRFTTNGVARAGYSVPVVAFVDNNNSGAFEVAGSIPVVVIHLKRLLVERCSGV